MNRRATMAILAAAALFMGGWALTAANAGAQQGTGLSGRA